MALTQQEIMDAIADPVWQQLRRSLLGTATSTKIARLNNYMLVREGTKVEIQVENYLNALKRGGLLKAFRMQNHKIVHWEDKTR